MYTYYSNPDFLLFQSFLLKRVYMLTRCTDITFTISAIIWIVFSALIVAIVHIKTIAKFLVRNVSSIEKWYVFTTRYSLSYRWPLQ